MTTVVAIDLGASSGRVLRGVFNGERVEIDECARFPNGPVALPAPGRAGSLARTRGGEAGVRYEWDVLALWQGVVKGLREAARRGSVDAIGIDTWAVDYGLLDEGGLLVGNPASYRSARCGPGAFRVLDRWEPTWLYERNGLQYQPFNTIFQRVADRGERRADCASTALLMPDLLAYWLTGEARSELTNASTTGLVNARARNWDRAIVERLRDDFDVEHLFPPIIAPGEVIGEALVEGLNLRTSSGGRTPVVAVGSHDTASAVVGVPALVGSFAYISSGTWSLVGTELPGPVLTRDAQRANFTNELGVDGTVRFLTNIMGMWVQQECLREWANSGDAASGVGGRVDWPLLDAQTEASEPLRYLLDMSSPALMTPGGMVARVISLRVPGPGSGCVGDEAVVHSASLAETELETRGLEATGEVDPALRATVLRAITDSLALAYRRAVHKTFELSGTRCETIHLVGGGCRNRLLAQETADATGIPVVAGPVEATALGNMLVSLRTVGATSGTLADLRGIARASSVLMTYEPRAERAAIWEEAEALLGSARVNGS